VRGDDDARTLRIELDDPIAQDELVEILHRSGCAVLESDAHTIHVSSAERDRHGDIELLFFVRAWAAKQRSAIVVALED
jgi:hypothetical protein